MRTISKRKLPDSRENNFDGHFLNSVMPTRIKISWFTFYGRLIVAQCYQNKGLDCQLCLVLILDESVEIEFTTWIKDFAASEHLFSHFILRPRLNIANYTNLFYIFLLIQLH